MSRPCYSCIMVFFLNRSAFLMPLISFYNPATRYQWFNTAWMLVLLFIPVLLWWLPAGFFDDTGVELCPSRAFFDVECFGCGITRAVMHLHHFEWQEAIYYNYLVVIVYPVLVALWFLWLYKSWKRHRTLFSRPSGSISSGDPIK